MSLEQGRRLGKALWTVGSVLSASQWIAIDTRGHADVPVATIAILMVLSGLYLWVVRGRVRK